MSNPLFTIIIPTHRRNDLLKAVLESVYEIDYPESKYEVIVVGWKEHDSSSVVRSFNKKNLFYYETVSRFQDAKRNLGAKKALGKYLVFTDDDTQIHKDWLKEIEKSFKQGYDGVEGKTIGDVIELMSKTADNRKGGLYLACNYAFTKEAFDSVGGFDEAYSFGSDLSVFREDTDLAYRIMEKGYKIVFNPNAIVYHPARRFTTAWELLADIKKVGGDIRLWKKYPRQFLKTYKFPGLGALKQSFLAWVFLFLGVWFYVSGFFLGVFSLVIIWYLFKYVISMRKRTFSLWEGFLFGFVTFLRDLIFPLYFFKYMITVRI